MRKFLKWGCGGIIGLFVLLIVLAAIFGKKPDVAASLSPTAAALAQNVIPTATRTPQPTLTPVPPKATATPAPPTATPSPGDTLTKLANDQFSKQLRSAKLETVEKALYATVDYDLGVQWDENSAVRSVTLSLVQFAPKVFAGTSADALELRSLSEFTDVYGKKTTDVATKFTVSRETASKVNWPGIDRRNLGLILSGDSDGVYVHPALRKAWLSYVSGQ